MLFVILQVIAGICEMQYIGVGEITKLQSLMSPDFPDYNVPIIGAVASFVTVAWDYIQVLWDMFWFDYPFFAGAWMIVRFIFFIPVSIGMIVSLVLATVRGVSA